MNIATREIIIPKLRRYFATQPIERVWLFGSFSRGEETETSDVDLLALHKVSLLFLPEFQLL